MWIIQIIFIKAVVNYLERQRFFLMVLKVLVFYYEQIQYYIIFIKILIFYPSADAIIVYLPGARSRQ